MTLVPKKAFAEGKLERSREIIIGSTSMHRVVYGSLPVPTALDVSLWLLCYCFLASS